MVEWIVSSSVLIAAVILLRFVLRGRISLRVQYALWGLVLLRLLVPFSVGTLAWSAAGAAELLAPVEDAFNGAELELFVEEYHEFRNWEEYEAFVEENRSYGIDGKMNSEFAQLASGADYIWATVPVTVPWNTVLHCLWAAGGIAAAVWFITVNVRFSLRLKRSRKVVSVEYCSLPVYVSDAVDTPCLFGLLHPAIYLTCEAAEDPQTMRHAVEHERTHYLHGDHIWAILRCACLALHWYDPLVWWAALLSRNDGELACDEATILRLGEEERGAYGRTLIRLTCEKRPALVHTATTMTGSGRSIRERIALIVKKPKMAAYTLAAVLVVAAVAAVCAFSGAEKDAADVTPPLPDAPSVSTEPSQPIEPSIEPSQSGDAGTQTEEIDLTQIVNSIFVGKLDDDESWQSSGDYTLEVAGADGRTDAYLRTPERYPYFRNTPGLYIEQRMDLVLQEQGWEDDFSRNDYILTVSNRNWTVTVYSNEDKLKLRGTDGREWYFVGEDLLAGSENRSNLFWHFLNRFGLTARGDYERDSCSVDGARSDYAAVAWELAEQYAQRLVERPAWFNQPALDAQVVSVEVIDAYYGAENPRFVFNMWLALKIEEGKTNNWQVGAGLFGPYADGPLAGYYRWPREVSASKGADGHWHITGMGGDSWVWQPGAVDDASIPRLVELYFLTEGKSRDWRILYALSERPLAEVQEYLQTLPAEEKRELTEGILNFIREYSYYTTWKPEDFTG